MDWILLGIPIGAVMLYFGSDWMVDGAKAIALRFGVSPFIVGLTIVAFGSSSPEFITSVMSAGTSGIVIGNVVGSNVANIGLAIGLAALISPIVSDYSEIRFELWMTVAAVGAVFLMAADGVISIFDGIVLFALLAFFVFTVYRLKKGRGADGEAPDRDEDVPLLKNSLMVVAGTLFLYFGADLFIDGAKSLALDLGVSELLIGLLVVAIGVALPELCVTVAAALRGENELVVSNIIGSVIFNCFFALAAGAVISDIAISGSLLTFHMPIMLALALALAISVRMRGGVGRLTGAVLVCAYACYIAAMVLFSGLTV